MTVDQIKAYLQEKKLDCIDQMEELSRNSYYHGIKYGENLFIREMLEWIEEQENDPRN